MEGFECKFYRNDGTYDTPEWVEIPLVGDLRCPMSFEEVKVMLRKMAGWTATEPGAANLEFSFDTVWDNTDEDFQTLLGAFLGRTAIEFQALTGDIEVAGSQGPRATCKILRFDRGEPVGGVVTAAVTIKPCISDHPPEWTEIEA